MELIQWLCSQIDMQPELIPTTEYMEASEDVIDLREVIHPKKSAGEMTSFCQLVPYYQVFDSRHGFQPDLSIVDLLFNMGPESLLVLRNSVKL